MPGPYSSPRPGFRYLAGGVYPGLRGRTGARDLIYRTGLDAIGDRRYIAPARLPLVSQ